MRQILDFLTALRSNNNREWFNTHKDEYLLVKQKIESFTAELIEILKGIEPEASMLRPSDCLYRIYRDTRFSTDKTPYKTHIGIYLNPKGGKKSEYCGYYVHIEPGDCFVAGGSWWPPAPLLKAIRKDIYDNAEEYLGIINNPDFKAKFPSVGDDFLKTSPKGYPKDWEYIDLLKPRSFTAFTKIPERTLTSKGLLKVIREDFDLLKPFNDFFNFTIDENPELAFCRPRREK
ncbi:MAG: DUF2461 domain-containing protein [Muribaculaceae bacterium]|nr:DUF2461 domain-containing protein [Muribaculaceae bacterium]